uniref:hypothetical protein n=2 Tax=Campylobacter lari TaxID=201 RepID=UPI00159613FA|nr:hypothetical protein [Campylobacter lari]
MFFKKYLVIISQVQSQLYFLKKGEVMELKEKRKIIAKFNKAVKDLTILKAEKKRIEAKIKNAEKIIDDFKIIIDTQDNGTNI